MKVLVVHNSYKIKGGEDTVVQNEIELLRTNGVEVVTYFRNNHEIDNYSTIDKIGLIHSTTYSEKSFDEIARLIEKHSPDLCHVHNTLPLISPSVYNACQKKNVPVVQTLHNYRLGCINGLLLREQKPCEDCITKNNPFEGVKHKCYRNSYVQSYAVARMLSVNRKKGFWNSRINRFICLTPFAKNKFIEIGIDQDLIAVKPNFISVELDENDVTKTNKFQVLYMGRLEESKGIQVFLELSKEFSDVSFVVIGKNVENIDFTNFNVEYKGELPYQEAQSIMARSSVLVFPSIWYEGMPMTILEAFALKTVVIASNLGAMSSMIQHEKNGLLFNLGDVQNLAKQLTRLRSNPELLNELKNNASSNYKELYTPTSNVQQLLSIYKSVLK